jgi:hypothetical protein
LTTGRVVAGPLADYWRSYPDGFLPVVAATTIAARLVHIFLARLRLLWLGLRLLLSSARIAESSPRPVVVVIAARRGLLRSVVAPAVAGAAKTLPAAAAIVLPGRCLLSSRRRLLLLLPRFHLLSTAAEPTPFRARRTGL